MTFYFQIHMGEGGAVVEGEDEVGAEVDMQIIKVWIKSLVGLMCMINT